RDATHDRCGLQAPGRRDRLHCDLAHLGPEPAASPASALRGTRRRPLARWPALDRLPTWLLPAGAGVVATVSAPVPHAFAQRLRRRRAALLPWAGRAARSRRVRSLSLAGRTLGMGGLR